MIDCPANVLLSGTAYQEMFSRKVEERRIPVSGTIALTHRCNLHCLHCYVGPSVRPDGELTTGQWISLIDAMVEAGCLYLVITGGEPLVRSDFAEIYSHAKRSGLITTVFTNGTLITPEIVELFQDLPPSDVEITLYGMSAETYKRVCGQAGAFAKAMTGIERLREASLPFHLKTVVMTSNLADFHKIRDFATRYDTKFRLDAALFPRLDGDQEPISLRIDPEMAIDLELENPETVQGWLEFFQRQGQGAFIPPDKLYTCGTGLTSFYVDAHGMLKPCLLVDRISYNLLEGPFSDGWQDIGRIRDIEVDKGVECAQCQDQPVCGFCPAFFKLEQGSEEIKSSYLCDMGYHRARKILGKVAG